VQKALRGALLVPIFGFLLVLLRVRAALVGPVRVLGVTPAGDRFECDLPDLIQMYVYLFGVWEPDLAALIRRRLREGDVFVDVGANIGFDTMIASRCVGERGRVVAIEASPAMCDRLRGTLSDNGRPSNVRVIQGAAGAARGTVDVYAGPSHNVGLATTVRRGAMPHVARVDVAPLGDLLTAEEIARVRLIKIDVEGGEDAVLAGLLSCVESLPRAAEVAVELSPLWWSDRSKTAADVLQPYVDRGFFVYSIRNNYWPWRYLWPHDVEPPLRVRDARALTRRTRRLDVVLSRTDAERLA
jgi:FkbM family methyltransferase